MRMMPFFYVGLINYFLIKVDCPKSEVMGIFNENFVYLDLRRRIQHPRKIALEIPAFATLGSGEIDFYVKSLKPEKTYAVEVKAGKQSGRTATEALSKGKADYLLYAKGDTHGGKVDKTITIPVYGIAKYQFNNVAHTATQVCDNLGGCFVESLKILIYKNNKEIWHRRI